MRLRWFGEVRSSIFFFFDNSGIWAATFPTILPKGVQRPNGRDVKSVVAKARTQVAGSTAVPPLPPSYEHLVVRSSILTGLVDTRRPRWARDILPRKVSGKRVISETYRL
ncbi:Uncharacterized protein Rs2_10232 [Raphanus sativus]|nr:Uncharacterized protein Rs2_10232 [Raphanus sativus]